MDFGFNQANTTPAPRDLQQSISPNPKAQSKALWLTETSGQDLQRWAHSFAAWEDQDYAAIIIDTRGCFNGLKDLEYLKVLRSTVSCPILRWHNLQEKDDVLDSRLLGFDGLISTGGKLTKKDFFEVYKHAQSIHFRLIPFIEQKSDWEFFIPTDALFYAIDASYSDVLPPFVTEGRRFLLTTTDASLSSQAKVLMHALKS